jgi:hypothetical protein
MCMNCGCGQPHEDHGKPENITAATLERAGSANGQSLRESAQHIVEAVELINRSRADGGHGGQGGDRGDRGLAQPAGPTGGQGGGRGTPESES